MATQRKSQATLRVSNSFFVSNIRFASGRQSESEKPQRIRARALSL
jgi:hypothetical protein